MKNHLSGRGDFKYVAWGDDDDCSVAPPTLQSSSSPQAIYYMKCVFVTIDTIDAQINTVNDNNSINCKRLKIC